MTNIDSALPRAAAPQPLRWRELWLKEDWWAIWLGLGIVLVAYLFFANGASIKWLTVTPAKWSTLSQLGAHFAANYVRYIAQFVGWLAVFTVALAWLARGRTLYFPSIPQHGLLPTEGTRHQSIA